MAMITINANTAAIAAQGGIDFEAYIRGGFLADTAGSGFPTFDGGGGFSGEEMFIGYGAEATSKYVLAQGDLAYNFGTHTVAGTINTIEYGTRGEGAYDENGAYVGGDVALTISGLDLSNPVPTTPAEEVDIEENGPVHNFASAHMYGAAAEQHDLDVYADSLDQYAQKFLGSTGDDVYSGTSHDDIVQGNDGTDTVVFSGNQADYLIYKNPNGTLFVADQRTGEVVDGTDKLVGVENVQFADGTLAADDVAARPMLTIDAKNVSGQLDGINFDTFVADYLAGLSAGSYKFYGGTPDSFYGSTYYMNGDQVAFEYQEDGATSSDRILLGGEDMAYDFIHYGASYGHGLSGVLDTLTFGQWTDSTTGTQGTGEAGLIQGLLEALKISGIGIDVEPGTGSTNNPLSDFFNAVQSGDVAAINAYLAQAPQHFIGTDGDDTYTGTTFNDIIEGGLGTDTLAGKSGSDIYYVDDASDVVIEEANAGEDTVFASGDYTLGANIETLRADGDAAHVLTGNTLNNLVIGGAGNDTLDGGVGADTLRGGLGDDVYVVDNAGDVIVERGQGFDTVRTTIDFALADGLRVEALEASAGSGLSLTGNAFAQTLLGGNHRDTLDGSYGKDVLEGGAGNDFFEFTADVGRKNADIIVDFSAGDRIGLDADIFSELGTELGTDNFVIGRKALDANDYVIYNPETGQLLYDADGAGGAKAQVFATAGGDLSLTHKDFFLI